MRQVWPPLNRQILKEERRISEYGVLSQRAVLLQNEEKVETLTQLGLTLNQARAYLALLQSGPAAAKKLSEAAKITRQDIYRVMPTLEQVGIVERLISSPTVYEATPIQQGTRILLERKTAEHNELRRKTRELVRIVKKSSANQEFVESDALLVMIPGKEAIIQKIGEALQKTKRSIEVVTSRKRFSPAIFKFRDNYTNALERGVRIRVATEKPVAEKAVCEIVERLMENGGFEVKCFSDVPPAVVSIFDGREASVTLSQVAHTPRASALWSNDACFVALAQNYFETKWSSSTEFNRAFSTS